MSTLTWVIAISIGAAGGAVLRHVSYVMIEKHHRGDFPVTTLFVNLLGSFLIGVFVALGTSGTIDPFALELLVGGGCGSLTTFSSLSADWLRLNRSGRKGLGVVYVGLTLVLGLSLAAGGLALGGAIS